MDNKPLQPDKPKHPGQPPKFTDPEELEKQIEAYFKDCDQGREVEELTKRGELVKYNKKRPYTIEGMADWLKISPETIRNYGKTDRFFWIISRAKNKIHQSWVEMGLTDNYNSKITALCLAANNPAYRINQENTLKVSLSIEDAIKQIQERRRQPVINHSNQDVLDV